MCVAFLGRRNNPSQGAITSARARHAPKKIARRGLTHVREATALLESPCPPGCNMAALGRKAACVLLARWSSFIRGKSCLYSSSKVEGCEKRANDVGVNRGEVALKDRTASTRRMRASQPVAHAHIVGSHEMQLGCLPGPDTHRSREQSRETRIDSRADRPDKIEPLSVRVLRRYLSR